METYRIFILEDSHLCFEDIHNLAKELKGIAPQIDWIVCEEKILNYDNKYENYLCIKVPKVQYEAARYLYDLFTGSEKTKFLNDPILNDLEDNLGYLSHFCSFPVQEDELEEYLNKLSTILSDIYSIGTQLPEGINLHLKVEHDEPYEHFPDKCILDGDLIQEEMNVIRANINYILYETSKYCPILEEENNPLEAGIVYKTYESFHSKYGWGIRILETITLIRKLRSKVIETNDTYRSPGCTIVKELKTTAITWIQDVISNNNLFDINKYVDGEKVTNLIIGNNNLFSFRLIGFADQPEVFVQPTSEGIKFGYHSISWDHPHLPMPSLEIKYNLTWESLKYLTQLERETTVIDTFLKTIESRKRQYKVCQFCMNKVPPEQRFNTRTCHGCATEHFGIIY